MQTLPPLHTAREAVRDTLHGREIVDPYRWLEDEMSPRTREWVGAQNAHTRALLDALPGRTAIRARLNTLLAIGTVSAPRVRGERAFFTRRSGTQNQPVVMVCEPNGVERVIVDPNTVSAEGLVALDWWYPSWDGTLLAYGFSESGDEWSTLRVLDVETGEVLPDAIERTRFAAVAWLPDDSGFYYTRYPARGDVPRGEENYGKKVYLHRLGSEVADDPLIFGHDLEPEAMPWVIISRDGRYLVVSVSHGWERSDVYVRNLEDAGSTFVPVAVGEDAHFTPDLVNGTLYLLTNLGAPRYRLYQVDPAHPERASWGELIPEDPEAVLESVTFSDGRILGQYLRNAVSRLTVFGAEGERQREVDLPALGTVTGVNGTWDTETAYVSFESFTLPPTVLSLHPATGQTARWAAVEADINSDDYTVEQQWYTSRDGTRVSMFIVAPSGLDRSIAHPTLLTGYGGFNLSRTPLFAPTNFVWLEHGGVYALPNLRGGGEYGEEWHRAGMLERKQNVFDDFIGAAEHVIAQGYTDTDHLTIAGRSNGGLLVGAALTQRPDLFRAVVCGVPLLDMLRYHMFQIARLWIPEYGTAENPDQFPFIHAYSPYHHVEEGVCYPATLLVTAEADTRVDPLHARKMAALLQAAQGCDRPILLSVEAKAGHGMGKPLVKVVDDQTDFWSFLFWQVGVQA